jgi:hypothetical protein
MDIGDVVKMPFEFRDLFVNVGTHRVGDIDMVTSQVDLHGFLLALCSGQALAFVRRRDRHRFTVFGNGSPRHVDALICQYGGNLVIR